MRTVKRIVVLIISFIFCGQFSSCAKRVFPKGGEGDVTPPAITIVYPENKSLNVNPKTAIKIRFSEWIDPKTVESGIIISPQTDFTVKVNARNIEIMPKTPFSANTSYHVSFLGDITDFTGNKLTETKSIIFSTGDFIDTSNISGRIFFEKADSLLPKVALFFDERAAQHDTILLSTPDYITQADSLGYFRFDNISETKYRVIGFLDNNRNNRITPLEPVFLSENQISKTGNSYELFPAASDTTQNMITAISAFSPVVLSMKLKFATEKEPFENIQITNVQENKPIQIEKTQRLDDNQTIAVFLQDSLQNRQYSLETKAPKIISSIEDTIFSDTVLFNGTTLVDTINLARLDSLLGNYTPKTETPDTNNAVAADTSDTTLQIAVSPRLLWNFIGELPANPLWELRNENGISISTTDNFIENIPVGKYSIFIIDDRNQNNKFDTGTLFPWNAGEKRIKFPDILHARERWEAEYDIAFPNTEQDIEQNEDSAKNSEEVLEQ